MNTREAGFQWRRLCGRLLMVALVGLLGFWSGQGLADKGLGNAAGKTPSRHKGQGNTLSADRHATRIMYDARRLGLELRNVMDAAPEDQLEAMETLVGRFDPDSPLDWNEVFIWDIDAADGSDGRGLEWFVASVLESLAQENPENIRGFWERVCKDFNSDLISLHSSIIIQTLCSNQDFAAKMLPRIHAWSRDNSIWRGWMTGIAEAQPFAMLASLDGHPAGGSDRAYWFSQACRTGARTDPARVMSLAGVDKWAVLNEWLEKDVDAAFAWAQLNEPELLGRMWGEEAIPDRLFDAQVVKGPLAFIESLGDASMEPSDKVYAQCRAFKSWLRLDPNAAMQWWKGQDSFVRLSMFKYWDNVATDSTPGQQLRLLDSACRGEAKVASMRDIVRGWAEKDPEGALAWMESLPRGAIRSEMLAHVGMRLLMNADDETKGQLLLRAPEIAWCVRDEACFNLMKYHDFDLALEALGYMEGESRREALTKLVTDRLSSKGQNKYEWGILRDLLDDMLPGTVGVPIPLDVLNFTSPHEEMKLISRLQGDDAEFVRGIVASYAYRSDPARALALLSGMSRERAWETARAIVSNADAYGGGQELLEKVDGGGASIENPVVRDFIKAAFVTHMAKEDPRAALELLRKYGIHEGYTEALGEIVYRLGSSDLAGAEQLVKELPSGGMRDHAVSRMIGEVAQVDPLRAFDWVESMEDDTLRGESLGEILTEDRCRELPPDVYNAMKARLEQASLPDAVRQELLLRLRSDVRSTQGRSTPNTECKTE